MRSAFNSSWTIASTSSPSVPGVIPIHFHEQYPIPVRGRVRHVRHGVFVLGQVDVTLFVTAIVGCDDPHVRTLFDLRKQQLPRAGPDQTGRVAQP